MRKLLILGAGSFARSIADVVAEIQAFDVIGFVVDTPPFERGSKLADKPIFWIDEVPDLAEDCWAICAFSSMKRICIIEKVQSFGIPFTTIIHPSAYIAKTVKIGFGVIINSGAQVAARTNINDHVIINRGALIGHDVTIKKYSVISPGANIAGKVNIGAKTMVGMGANIIDHVNIGGQCFIGAGSLVIKEVPDRVKVVGVPAKIIERKIKEV